MSDCKGCDCGCQDCDTCGPRQVAGPRNNANVLVVETGTDYAVDTNIDNVDTLADGVKVTLPKNATIGRAVKVNAVVGDAIVQSGDPDDVPIAGGDDLNVAQGSSVVLTLAQASCDDPCSRTWIPLGGGGEGEQFSADYVLVGLGTAGCALARYLSEDMKTSVLALEAGKDLSGDPNVTGVGPTSSNEITINPKYAWIRSVNASLMSLGLKQIWGYSDGRMWGGGSGHNGLVASHASPPVFDEWAADSGSSRWSYNNVLPFSKFLETYVPNGATTDPAQRGFTGPIGQLCSGPFPLPLNPFITVAASAAGLNVPIVDDYNIVNANLTPNIGIAPFQRYGHQTAPPVNGTWATGTRTRSWAQEFLPFGTVVNPDGTGVGARKLRIVSDSVVTKIVIESVKGRLTATGVEYFFTNNPNKILFAKAKKKVILCAGTNANPQLLQLSGVGPSALLTSLGIPVLFDNPNVGANMQNHYGPGGAIPRGTNPNITFDLNGNIMINTDGSGPNIPRMRDGTRRIQFNTRSNNVFVPPDVRASLNIASTPMVAFLSFILNPKSLGTVQINSNNPLTPPTISANFYTDAAIDANGRPIPTTNPYNDIQTALDVLYAIANVSLAYTGSLPIYPPPSNYPAVYGGTAPDNGLLIDQILASTLVAAYHNSGTCRMALSAATGVVDGNLDVFGIDGLSCCDNSVHPRITDANTTHGAMITGLIKAKIEGAVGLP